MFDASFIELVLIAVVALVVLGPERLPGAVRTAGLWIGRLKRSFNNIKKDIEKEIGADEIRRQLRNEEIMSRFDHTKDQFTKTIDSVKSQADSVKKDLDLKKQFSAVAGLAKGESKSDSNTSSKSTESIETPNISSDNNSESSVENTPADTNTTTSTNNSEAETSADTKPSEQK